MSTVSLLARSHELAAWVERMVHELPAPASLRTRCAGPCFIVTQEHHQAIVFLLDRSKPVYASAFSLVRLVYESLVRGLWLQHCATDAQVQAFSTGTEPPRMPALLKALKSTKSFSSGQLTAIYTRSWRAMCSYTHTGAHQVQRWNTSDGIEANYSEAEVAEILRSTGAFALLSLLGLAAICSDDALAQEALVKAREWSK